MKRLSIDWTPSGTVPHPVVKLFRHSTGMLNKTLLLEENKDESMLFFPFNKEFHWHIVSYGELKALQIKAATSLCCTYDCHLCVVLEVINEAHVHVRSIHQHKDTPSCINACDLDSLYVASHEHSETVLLWNPTAISTSHHDAALWETHQRQEEWWIDAQPWF